MGLLGGKIADCGCSYASYWRYFHELQRRGKLKLIYQVLAREKTDVIEGVIDTTTATSFRFERMTGWDGKHKKIGIKISLFTDRKGLPADVDFSKGSKHDGGFVAGHLKKTAGRRKRVLNLDKIYTSLDLRRDLRKKGTLVNIERLISWVKSFWRITIRREYNPTMSKAFVYLALIIILIRN